MPDNTLLHLDHTPTLEELRTFFKENDFSTAVYREYDYENPSKEDLEDFEFMDYIKEELNKHWEPLAVEKGLKSGAQYYGADNPLTVLQKGTGTAISTAVLRLLEECPEELFAVANEKIATFATDDPTQLLQKAEQLLHNTVNLTMDVMQYEEIAAILNEAPAHQDFNHQKATNYRAQDFDRKWNHTRASMATISLEALNEGSSAEHKTQDVIADVRVNLEEDVIAAIAQQTFWESVSESDKLLLQLRMNGLSQKEIAEQLGYKTHTAVTKRLQQLKNKFKKSLKAEPYKKTF